MNDFENLLTQVMHEHDEIGDGSTTTDPRPAAETQELTMAGPAPHRRRRVIFPAVAAAAVLAVAGIGVGLGHSGSPHQTASGPTSSATSQSPEPTSSATTAPPPAPIVWTGTDRTGATTTYRAVRRPLPKLGAGHYFPGPVEWRGLSISLYTGGSGTCNPNGVFAFGEGTSHHPQYNGDGPCTDMQPALPDLDSIVLGPDSGAGMIDHSAATTDFVVNGTEAKIGTARGYTYVWVPSRHVVASLLAGSVTQTEAYIGSMLVESQSSTKCPLTADPSVAPVNTRDGTDTQMVPAGAVEASYCSYQGTDLSFSRLIEDSSSTDEVAKTITGLNALTRTTSPYRISNEYDLRIFYRYASGPPVEIQMHMTNRYDERQFTNGQITRYGSDDAIDSQPI